MSNFNAELNRASASMGCVCVGGLLLSAYSKFELGRVKDTTLALDVNTGETMAIGLQTYTKEKTYIVWSEYHKVFLCNGFKGCQLIGFPMWQIDGFTVNGLDILDGIHKWLKRMGTNTFETEHCYIKFMHDVGDSYKVRFSAYDHISAIEYKPYGCLLPVSAEKPLSIIYDDFLLSLIGEADILLTRRPSSFVKQAAQKLIDKSF